jgi:hypothetical protein
MTLLNEITQRLAGMTPQQRAEAQRIALDFTARKPFVPHEGPQMRAYYSKADMLLFGGNPGGGKTGLLFGLAVNEHRNSLIIRKKFADLEGVITNCKDLLGTSEGFIGGQRPKYRKPDGGRIDFEGMGQDGGVDTGKQGVARDFIGIDEGAQLTEVQVRALFGWLRTTDKAQRVRLVIGSNPPLDPTGDWMVPAFAPWLLPDHPRPAKDGELRWFIYDDRDASKEVDGPDPITIDGKIYRPHSRSFIRSDVTDNPCLDAEDYKRRIDMMPEPYRTILREGNFIYARRDQDYQVIPTLWIRAAVARWKETPPPKVPMCAIAMDVACGGHDETVVAYRHDGWYGPLVEVPGTQTPNGKSAAAFLLAHRRDNAHIVVDMGGGYGQAPYDALEENIDKRFLHGYVGSSSAIGRSKDGLLSFRNKRSMSYWMLREALDPDQEGGSSVALPDNPKLLADLAAPTFTISGSVLGIESKEDVVKKLGRSPDCGDAVVMAWSEGDRAILSHYQHGVPLYRYGDALPLHGQKPRVNLGYQNRRRGR